MTSVRTDRPLNRRQLTRELAALAPSVQHHGATFQELTQRLSVALPYDATRDDYACQRCSGFSIRTTTLRGRLRWLLIGR